VSHLSLKRNTVEKDGTHQVNELPSAIAAIIITNMSEINKTIKEIEEQLRNRLTDIEIEHSYWKYQYTTRIDINVMKYEPLRGGSYMPLPAELNNKKCCINIKNQDDKCLMYSVLYHIHKDDIMRDAERVSKYIPYLNEFDWSDIKFPVQLKDIHKIEKLIDFGINVFGYEKCSPFPLHITKRQDDKIINLLMIADLVNDKKVEHYVYIKKLDIFATPKRCDADGIQRKR